MNIIISGYGRMGKEVEKIVLERNHKIVAIIDNVNDFNRQINQIQQADVAIDFSFPDVAADNILRFFKYNIPVVIGTTGWFNRFEEIKNQCIEQKQTLFWSTNMSLGVNLYFKLNNQLAEIMNRYNDYIPSVEETHHIHKKDAPSGTAISLANDILSHYKNLNGWKLSDSEPKDNELSIKSIREAETIGEHKVCYHSDIDEIEIRHTAFNRKGLALGSVVAAEWLQGKKGVFTMSDLLK